MGRAGRLLLALLVCAASWAGSPTPTARAQEPAPPPSSPTLQAEQPRERAEVTSSGLWIYLLAMGLSLILLAVYLLRRARQQRFLEIEGAEEPALLPAPPERAEPAPDALATLARSIGAESPTPANALALQTARDTPLFAPRGEDHQKKECPACHRKYAAWMVVCPFDAQTLREPGPRHRPSRPARGAQTLPRKRCPFCERRFDEGALACPFDATPLVADTLEEAAQAPELTICRTCGKDLTELNEPCGCGEDADVITLDPSDTSARTPTLPMTVCPQCRTYGQLGQTHCPRDGELLVPVTSIQANSLPATGHGPRRKLCSKCGTRFSGAYVFCTQDGSRLTPVH